MENKIEAEIELPDGTTAYVYETEWRGKKRYFFDTVSVKYPSFTVTYTDDESAKCTLTYNQYTLLNQFFKRNK